MSDEGLSPCPFCGSCKTTLHGLYSVNTCHYGYCTDCETTGPVSKTKSKARRSWNKRALTNTPGRAPKIPERFKLPPREIE